MAPVPARKVIQPVFAPSPPWTKNAPMISCATVPRTISLSDLESLDQMATKVAIRARPTHTEARARTFSIQDSSAKILRNRCRGMTPRQESACQESSAVPGLMKGTAVSVNSFTVNNNFSTAKMQREVNGVCRVRAPPEHRTNCPRD